MLDDPRTGAGLDRFRLTIGSPDLIGFTYGAATGALVVILVWDGGTRAIAIGAIIAGFVTAAAVYLLSVRGGVQGYRLVLVGIGIGAMMLAVNDYLITRARKDDAYEAARWLVGSLNNAAWDNVIPIAVALAVLLPVALLLGRRLRMRRRLRCPRAPRSRQLRGRRSSPEGPGPVSLDRSGIFRALTTARRA